MAITFVNKSAFASGTAGLTVGAVASVVADDLILLFVESANENIATPTGYTQVTNSPVSTGTAAAAGGVRLAVFYRFATGADTSTSVADSGNHTTAIKMAFRGVDTTTPFDATPVTGIKTPASTSTSFPGITTTTANAWIVHASGLDLDAASTATTGAATNANLTGITERHDQTISGGVGGGLVVVTGTKATSGATGNTTATVTSTVQVYLTMALRELVLAARTGNLAATETGADTAALSGDVVVQGTAVATEPAGDDAFAASGGLSSGIAGTLAATETGADTASASGDVFISGALSATEAGSDTAEFDGIAGGLPPAPPTTPGWRHAGGRRGYIFKGKRYWLNHAELAHLIRDEQARIQDVQRLKRNKPKTISADAAKAIDAIIQSLNLPVESLPQTIDNDDDEALELLLTL